MKQKLQKNWPWLAGLLVAGLLCATYVLAQFRPSNPSGNGASSSLSAAEQVTAVRYFFQPLVWVGNVPPSENESQLLLEALELWKASTNRLERTELDEFLETLPDSPWAPSLHVNLGYYYRDHGQTTKALNHWLAAWEGTKDFPNGNGKNVGDFALAHLTRLLMVFGRTEDLAAIYEAYGNRVLDRGPLSQMWLRTYEKHLRMLKYPEDSYKCGIYALDKVAQALGLNYRRGDLLETPSKPAGFTMLELQGLSDGFGLGLIAVRRLETNGPIVVPSVVHWRQEHFAAIMERRGGMYRIADPSGLGVLWLTADEINAEATGYFMVPKNQLNAGFTQVAAEEAARVVGRVSSCPPNDLDDPPCEDDGKDDGCDGCSSDGGGPANGGSDGGDSGGCGGCGGLKPGAVGSDGGMPHWRVSEPFLNVWLEDIPLRYRPSKGPPIVLKMRSKMRDEGNRWVRSGISKSGKNWLPDWFTWGFVNIYDGYASSGGGEFHGGFQMSYSFPANTNWSNRLYENDTRMEVFMSGTNALGFMLHFPNGNRLKYAQPVFTNQWDGISFQFQLSEKIDPQGNKLTFNYTTNLLTSITDADGNSTMLYYENGTFPECVTRVSSPDGRQVTFSYDGDGLLTNIVDAAGISSSLGYDPQTGWISSLTTPYGTTSFANGFGSYGNYLDRWAIITQPDGGQHAYVLSDAGTGLNMPGDFQAGQLPANSPLAIGGHPYGSLEVTNRNRHNSFYWGPRQFAALGTTNLPAFTWTEFKRARIRHWIGVNVDAYNNHVDTINHEQDPSPDGTIEGQVTWYDYVGKDYDLPAIRGTQHLPTVTARVLPDGSTWYIWNQRNPLGHPTNVISTYTLPNGSTGLRTNTYVYSTNNIDMLRHTGPDGVTQAGYAYSTNHLVLFMTNALGEVTSYTYNANRQRTGTRTPAGLTTTNIYNGSGYLDKTIDLEIARTNSYTYYSSGNVQTHTDERNMTVTHTWDGLNRLTSTWYPDSTCTSNRYQITKWPMNVSGNKDRLGNWTSFGYDSVGRRTAVTNALSKYTLYTYCSCGTLDSVQDALNNTTSYYYDEQGRHTATHYPDGYKTTNTYNLLGQTINVSDSGGNSIKRWYNNQGLLVTVSNNVGLLASYAYDIDDRTTNSVDANGVSVDMAYDDLGRLRTRTYPDTGAERFGYSPRGLIAYTNQLDKVTFYAYDEATRKTFETNALNQVIRFQYDPAGNSTNIIDARNNALGYAYNAVNQLTNIFYAVNDKERFQYNADGNLTGFITRGGTLMQFGYDAAGHLTGKSYSGSYYDANYNYSYDAVGRLTNVWVWDGSQMATDQIFSYDAAGRLTNESVNLWEAGAKTIGYEYGAAGRRTKLRYPDGSFVTYAYNAVGWLTNISDGGTNTIVSYQYDTSGRRIKRTLENSTFTVYDYDNANQLTNIWHRRINGGTTNTISQYRYGYDIAGNRKWVKRANSKGDVYKYDATYQLTNVLCEATNVDTTPSAWTNSVSYFFDAAENRTNVVKTNSGTTTYKANALNQYTNVGSVPFQHDANGNLTDDGYWTYLYDDENKLRYAYDGYDNINYTYDGLGRLIERVGATTTRYYYAGWQLIAEYDDGDNLQAKYVYGPGIDEPVRMTRGGQKYYYHQATVNSVTEMTDSSGALVEQYTYDVYGNPASASAIENRLLFQGRDADPDTGLYNFRNRYYSPAVGRFMQTDPLGKPHFETTRAAFGWLSQDPLGEAGGINLYGFVGNNPVNRNDPLGLYFWEGIQQSLIGCAAIMDLAKDEANKEQQKLNEQYTCCVDGEPKTPSEAMLGGAQGNGLAHCLVGYYAKKFGASKRCLAAANVALEGKEFVFGREWAKKEFGYLLGWAADTGRDVGYTFGGYGASSPEGCLDQSCKKK